MEEDTGHQLQALHTCAHTHMNMCTYTHAYHMQLNKETHRDERVKPPEQNPLAVCPGPNISAQQTHQRSGLNKQVHWQITAVLMGRKDDRIPDRQDFVRLCEGGACSRGQSVGVHG